MEYQRFGSKVFVRMDPGEEILAQVKAVALKERIKLASVSAIGAVNSFTAGVYHVTEKKYESHQFNGEYEIISLLGTITTKDGEFYSHLHMGVGNDQGQMFGGHLNEAVISATCEMVIDIVEGQVERQMDEQIGLNVFRFLK